MEFARLRPMGATEIVDGAFTLYRRHFITFVVTALVPVLPGLLLTPVSRLVGQGVQMIGSLIVMGALVWQVSEAALGRQPNVGEGWRTGLRRFFPMLLNLLAYCIVLMLGFLALIVPGICLFCMLFAWQPVVVLERQKNVFGRSRALAKGQWGKISGVMLIAIVIAFLPSMALNLGAMSILQVGWMQASQSLIVVMGTALLGALLAPFSNAVIVLLYYDQRVRKEGLDVQLAVEAMGGATLAPAASAASAGARPAAS